MPELLPALLDSWDRNNATLLGLLRVVPQGELGVRATADGPTYGFQAGALRKEGS